MIARTLDFSWTYDVPPLQMFWMLTRLDHLVAKAEYLGHAEHSVVELRERDGLFRSITRRRVDVVLPKFVPKIFTPKNRITQTQLWEQPDWSGGRHYSTRVEIERVPAVIDGYGTLTPVDFGATRYEIHLNGRESRPLPFPMELRNRLADFLAQQVADTINGEHEFRMLWLSRRAVQGFAY